MIARNGKLVLLASIKTSDTVNATYLLEVIIPTRGGICANIKIDPISQSSIRVTEIVSKAVVIFKPRDGYIQTTVVIFKPRLGQIQAKIKSMYR